MGYVPNKHSACHGQSVLVLVFRQVDHFVAKVEPNGTRLSFRSFDTVLLVLRFRHLCAQRTHISRHCI
jgi:hypothetical protein